jgi:DUF1365 family protein
VLSRLYEGHVSHYREEPAHGFSYSVWYAWLNLDEIEQVCALSPCLSRERLNLLSFYRQDYLPDDRPLKASVAHLIKQRTGTDFDGEVYLLTTLRQIGYSSNPISLFYCFRPGEETPAWILAEVHNTPWGERYTYLIEPDHTGRSQQPKDFHVSPFMPMDTEYEFTVPAPGHQLNVGIRVQQSGRQLFDASLNLRSCTLNRENLHRLLRHHHWQSLKTISRIYYQALVLKLKNARFFAHPRRQAKNMKDLREKTI